jgi:MFS family permease
MTWTVVERRFGSGRIDAAQRSDAMQSTQITSEATTRSYLAVLAGAICCYAALGAVIRIVPGYVGDTLGESSFAVGLAVGAPALTAVVARPLGGALADRRGTRRIVSAAALLMAVGALPMFVQSYEAFLSSRLIVGAGEGAMMSATVLWLLRLAGPERRGRALGHIGLANYAGLTAGPLLAETLGGAAHPQRVFVAAATLPLIPSTLAGRVDAGPVPEPTVDDERAPATALAARVAGAGLGLLLMNIGYSALLAFGPAALPGQAALVIPVYAVTVIAVRTLAAGVPDRIGGRTTLAVAAPTAAAGLVLAAAAPVAPLALAGVVLLGAGQGFAIPALGLLALSRVPPAQHGAASGVFFAWFDLGVGIGGPLAGAAAALGGADAALATAAAAVACAAPFALALTRR